MTDKEKTLWRKLINLQSVFTRLQQWCVSREPDSFRLTKGIPRKGRLESVAALKAEYRGVWANTKEPSGRTRLSLRTAISLHLPQCRALRKWRIGLGVTQRAAVTALLPLVTLFILRQNNGSAAAFGLRPVTEVGKRI